MQSYQITKGIPKENLGLTLERSFSFTIFYPHLTHNHHRQGSHPSPSIPSFGVGGGKSSPCSDNGWGNSGNSTGVVVRIGIAGVWGISGNACELCVVYQKEEEKNRKLWWQRLLCSSTTAASCHPSKFARPLLVRSLEENNIDSLVDPRLEMNYNPNEMARMIACAASCVRHFAQRRPRMSQVVRALEGEVSVSDPNERHSSMYDSSDSEYST